MTTFGLASITETSQSWRVYILPGHVQREQKAAETGHWGWKKEGSKCCRRPSIYEELVYFTSLSVILSLYSLYIFLDPNS